MTIYASGNTIVLSLDAEDADKLRQLVMELVTRPSSSSTAPTQPAGDAMLEQIRKLGELRDAGFLSEEEFQAKKAELLGRI